MDTALQPFSRDGSLYLCPVRTCSYQIQMGFFIMHPGKSIKQREMVFLRYLIVRDVKKNSLRREPQLFSCKRFVLQAEGVRIHGIRDELHILVVGFEPSRIQSRDTDEM